VDLGTEWTPRAESLAAAAQEPAWALERRRAAASHFARLGLPKRTEELWRRTDFGTLEAALPSLDPFVAGPRTPGIADLPPALRSRTGHDNEALLIQRNRDVVLAHVPAALIAQGVVVSSMERALVEHPDYVREAFGQLLADEYDGWTALAATVRSGGLFVWVPDDVAAAAPIRFVQWLDGPGVLAAPRTVVVLGRGARATIVDEQVSETVEGTALHVGSTEVILGEDAKLVYATLEDWGRHVYHYSNQRAQVGRNAELQWIQTLLGGRMVKTNSYFDLAGPGSQAFVHGFMFGDKRQHFHLHTLQRHLVDHTTSDLLIKGCLKDRARSVYQGLIQVSEGAQRTDAYQANRNLLLSDTARADSIPGLEILANDVRCTHGATLSPVDREQLFYLMARGLSRAEAERLIVRGFFQDVLDRVELEPVREALGAALEARIPQA
jgi:Fe-S cluster assembly protein SufD